jgi:hypothetical protein
MRHHQIAFPLLTTTFLLYTYTVLNYCLHMLYGDMMSYILLGCNVLSVWHQVLVATNVLSRGVDVPSVAVVVNYELPVTLSRQADPAAYVHRVGRCARFGRHGTAISLLDGPEDKAIMLQIEAHFGFSSTGGAGAGSVSTAGSDAT